MHATEPLKCTKAYAYCKRTQGESLSAVDKGRSHRAGSGSAIWKVRDKSACRREPCNSSSLKSFCAFQLGIKRFQTKLDITTPGNRARRRIERQPCNHTSRRQIIFPSLRMRRGRPITHPCVSDVTKFSSHPATYSAPLPMLAMYHHSAR